MKIVIRLFLVIIGLFILSKAFLFSVVIIDKCLKHIINPNNKINKRGKFVEMPKILKMIGSGTLTASIFIIAFFTFARAIVHIKILGIPLLIISLIFNYSIYHWKIMIDSDGLTIFHNFRFKQKIPFSIIAKVEIHNGIMSNAEQGENMTIYVKEKKIIRVDEGYEGYYYLKTILQVEER